MSLGVTNMVNPGQVWENGKTVVKLQETKNNKLVAVTFLKEQKGRLHFSHADVLDSDSAFRYVKELNCSLTDKMIAIGK